MCNPRLREYGVIFSLHVRRVNGSYIKSFALQLDYVVLLLVKVVDVTCLVVDGALAFGLCTKTTQHFFYSFLKTRLHVTSLV